MLGILLLASCAAWYTLSPYLSAEYFGPMPTPEEACAYVACNSDYDKVEFVSCIRSEDDTTKYSEGGKMPAGWVGYKFRTLIYSRPDWDETVEVYPCLFEKASHEWSAGMVLTPITRPPGWHFLAEMN